MSRDHVVLSECRVSLQTILNSIASKPIIPANDPDIATAAAPVVGVALVEDSAPMVNVSGVDPEAVVESGEALAVLSSLDTVDEDDSISATKTLARHLSRPRKLMPYVPSPMSLTSVNGSCPRLVAQQPR
jgi:hypothetical protein